jgi:magnesium-transporting ATPase (P-type)
LAACTLISKLFIYRVITTDPEFIDENQATNDEEIKGCQVKSFDLIEDLAKVDHVFTDKTGTLTQNELIFKAFGVGDMLYRLEGEEGLSEMRKTITEMGIDEKQKLMMLLRCLCICHDVSTIMLKD